MYSCIIVVCVLRNVYCILYSCIIGSCMCVTYYGGPNYNSITIGNVRYAGYNTKPFVGQLPCRNQEKSQLISSLFLVASRLNGKKVSVTAEIFLCVVFCS